MSSDIRASGPSFTIAALAYLCGLLTGGLLLWITRPIAFGFPHGVATVGDLAKSVMTINYAPLLASIGQPNRQDVWETLCELIMKQSGLSREQIRPEASIVDDLGIC